MTTKRTPRPGVLMLRLHAAIAAILAQAIEAQGQMNEADNSRFKLYATIAHLRNAHSSLGEGIHRTEI